MPRTTGQLCSRVSAAGGMGAGWSELPGSRRCPRPGSRSRTGSAEPAVGRVAPGDQAGARPRPLRTLQPGGRAPGAGSRTLHHRSAAGGVRPRAARRRPAHGRPGRDRLRWRAGPAGARRPTDQRRPRHGPGLDGSGVDRRPGAARPPRAGPRGHGVRRAGRAGRRGDHHRPGLE